MSVRKATDLASFSQGFSSRIVSLSRTHTMLVDHHWDRIEVDLEMPWAPLEPAILPGSEHHGLLLSA